MPILRISTTALSAIAASIINGIDAGAGPGLVRFYTGAMPATPATAVTSQTLLGTLTCSDPCATLVGAVITFAAITQDASADATGAATWARITDSTGAVVMDVDVTNLAGTGSIKLNTVDIVAGGPILLNSFVINIGA